jgi:D-beta-D-heptose 7-phosphate kinase / D-beta-D-heptose 1-phosphate adenosyltransferase
VTSGALAAIDGFAGRRVLVLGEAMLDSYLIGDSTRLCQEAPVPVVAVRHRHDHPGGAANTAVNLAALGCQVELLSVVGDDSDGRRLCQLLAQYGVGIRTIGVQADRQTLVKHRVVNGDRLIVRVDQGSTAPVAAAVEDLLIERLASAYPQVDALVISDYGYGVVTDRVIKKLEALQAASRRLIAVDARDLTRYRAAGITAVKPNYEEATRLVGASASATAQSRADAAIAAGEQILRRTGARIAAITLDRDGAVVVERGRSAYRTHANPADQSRAAGAGDTYIGAFALALAAGAPTATAAEIASAAASVVVGRAGTSACTAGELRSQLRAARSPRPSSGEPAHQPDLVRGLAGAQLEDTAGAEPADVVVEIEERRDRDDLGTRRAPALHQA